MTKAEPIAALCALAVLAGCGNDFDPYSRLTRLRVLAIASEPPAPAMGETATLTPLLYAPEGTPTPTFAWSWCPAPGPASEGYPCLISEAELAQGGVAVPPYDLGTGPTGAFRNTVPPEILARLCAGIPGSKEQPDCSNGFPVQIGLTVMGEGEPIRAVYTLYLRFDPATPPNRNPHLAGLSVLIDDTLQPLGDTPQAVLPRKVETKIQADVPEEDAESYPGTDSAGNPAEVRERLTLSWFVESGDLHDSRTGFIDGVTTFADATANRWKPASEKDYPRDTARIIVVVRDSRGGVAWRSGAARIGAGP